MDFDAPASTWMPRRPAVILNFDLCSYYLYFIEIAFMGYSGNNICLDE